MPRKKVNKFWLEPGSPKIYESKQPTYILEAHADVGVPAGILRMPGG